MRTTKRLFLSKHKRLLHRIEKAKFEEERLFLPNGVVLDFQPGHEYDNQSFYMLPCEYNRDDFIKKYTELIDQVIELTVYDCFSGDVKVLAVGGDRIFVEIVDVNSCYSCQMIPTPGSKYWVGVWEMLEYELVESSFKPSDLPF